MKAPSYRGYVPSSESSSRSKRSNRRSDTLAEVALRRELWALGLRYRKNVETMPGKPDLVFIGSRVVVFCDGDFWHGRHWRSLRAKLSRRANADYWIAKIRANIVRDRKVTRVLERDGWEVVRLWETDIHADTRAAARHVKTIVDERRQTSRKA